VCSFYEKLIYIIGIDNQMQFGPVVEPGFGWIKGLMGEAPEGFSISDWFQAVCHSLCMKVSRLKDKERI
jgi:hypothetical protein